MNPTEDQDLNDNPNENVKNAIDRYMTLLKAARLRRRVRPLGALSLLLFAAGFILGLWSPQWGYYTFCAAAFLYVIYVGFILSAREAMRDYNGEE